MIRIWTGNMVSIEEDEFERAKILEEYQPYKKNSKVKFVVRNKEKIIRILDYRDILLKRTICNNIIIQTSTLFDDASEYFHKIENLYSGNPIGVVDQSGKLKFILEYFDNNNFIEKRPQHYYQWFYTRSNKVKYDKKRFQEIFYKGSIVVFQSAEEYTIHLATILLEENKKHPQFKLYFLDEKALLFFKKEQINIISNCWEIKENDEYIMIVTGKNAKRKYPATDKRSVYQSVEIMMLLYEEELVKQLSPHTERPFLIYNDSLVINGIADFMKFSIRDSEIAQHKGYIPVINISDNIAYSDGQGENAWDYYFNPIAGYSVDQAYASKNYIVSSRDYFTMAREQFEECRKYNVGYFNVHERIGAVDWKPEIAAYCESEIPKEFKESKRILGVISRGTDYNEKAVIKRRGKDEIRNTSVEELIQITKQKIETEQYDYIYLATEDYYNYCQYIKAFGDKVLVTKQERIDLIQNQNYTETVVARIPKEKWVFEYGLDYLVVLRTLAKCDALLSSMRCGAYTAAVGLNNNKYESITLANLIQ